MNEMVEIFLLGLYIAWPMIVFGIVVWVIVFIVIQQKMKQAIAQFHAMTPAQQFAVLQALAAQQRWQQMNRYVSNSPGPMTESLMHYGAANGLDTSFLDKYR